MTTTYECTNCGQASDEVSACETCEKMACANCVESDYWSDQPHQCAECAAR